jgi:hypothetical protein
MSIPHDYDHTDAERGKSFAHALAQLTTPRARQADLRRDEIAASQFRRRTRTVDRLAYGRGGGRDTDAQRIRWSSQTFADHALLRVHDDGLGLRAAAVNTHHRILCMQASGWGEICCASFGAHNRGSGGPKNTLLNIFNYSRSQ